MYIPLDLRKLSSVGAHDLSEDDQPAGGEQEEEFPYGVVIGPVLGAVFLLILAYLFYTGKLLGQRRCTAKGGHRCKGNDFRDAKGRYWGGGRKVLCAEHLGSEEK